MQCAFETSVRPSRDVAARERFAKCQSYHWQCTWQSVVLFVNTFVHGIEFFGLQTEIVIRVFDTKLAPVEWVNMIRKKLKLAAESKSNDVVSADNAGRLSENAVASDVAITSQHFQMPFWQRLYDIECRLSAELRKINFHSKDIAAVYNPIEYAADMHCDYMRKYLDGPKSVLFVGMNPGPYGMVQTGVNVIHTRSIENFISRQMGRMAFPRFEENPLKLLLFAQVPFGCIPVVRDWLKISGTVNKPEEEVAARPVLGFDCNKSEQSGQRFWSLIQDVCANTPANFFSNCFVYNYCPLAFFQSSGRNITPAEIKVKFVASFQSVYLAPKRHSFQSYSICQYVHSRNHGNDCKVSAWNTHTRRSHCYRRL